MNRQQKTNNRIQQQRLRDRRKEEGWKRVTVWISPEVATYLQSIDSNLGTAIYEVINKLSDNCQQELVNDEQNKLPDNQFEHIDNPVEPVKDDVNQPVKKSGIKYHDTIKRMAWKMRCEGLTRAQIADAIQLEVGEPLPKSFMSHLNRIIKAGKQIAERDNELISDQFSNDCLQQLGGSGTG
jgi:hypothetical protein